MKNYNYLDMNRLIREVSGDFDKYRATHPNLAFSFDDNCCVADNVTSVLTRIDKKGNAKTFTAKCSSNDIYDMSIGFMLVMLKAMGVQYTPKALNYVWFRARHLMPTEKFIYENKVYITEYIDKVNNHVIALDEKGKTYHLMLNVFVRPVM